MRAVAWSPDGRFLLSGGDDLRLKVWQVELGELSAEYPTPDKIMSLSAAPKGSLAAVVLESGALKVVDFETGVQVFSEQCEDEVTALAWSSDGRLLAFGTDKLIQVWDIEDQKLVQSIDTGNDVLALGWNSTSELLASGSYRGIMDLWSTASGDRLWNITGHIRAVKALAWSPRGDFLASGGEDYTVRIWDVPARQERFQLRPGSSGAVEDLAWSPEGTYLASGGHDLLVRVWDFSGDDYEFIGAFTERIRKPFLHAEGFEFAVGMKNVSHEDIVLGLSWAPNGKKLASASWDKTVAIWDVPAGKQQVGIENPQGWVTAVAWAPYGDQVAFGGRDQAVHVYSGTTGKEIKSLRGTQTGCAP